VGALSVIGLPQFAAADGSAGEGKKGVSSWSRRKVEPQKQVSGLPQHRAGACGLRGGPRRGHFYRARGGDALMRVDKDCRDGLMRA
jgi:hypothetical protein